MNIGKFESEADGRITGALDVLPIGRLSLTFEPNTKGADYTVIMTDSGMEVGAAWKRTAKENGKVYVSVRLDSPFLLAPINLALFPAMEAGKHNMVWDRQRDKVE
jgi:uncharacterized protein (DUF736 family)